MKRRARLCVVVAPFDPTARTDATGLGATRKIAGVVRMFCEHGWNVIVVDSSHSHVGRRPGRVQRLRIGPGIVVPLVSPATHARRSSGKFWQLFSVRSVAHRLARKPVDLLWIYNAYAFEALFAATFPARQHVPLVLELEDWPSARSRGWRGVKNLLDGLGLRLSLPRARIVTCVNDELARLPAIRAKAIAFPGLVEAGRFAAGPVVRGGGPLTLGYFGSLHVEKGAGIVRDLVPRLPRDTRLLVTGDGPLKEEFRRAADAHPGGLEFHGVVSGEELVRLQARCDAFLNPHRPIAEMGNGVFPFKIFEYLSHAKPVLSTALPPVTPDVTSAIIACAPTVDAFLAGIERLPRFARDHGAEIESVAATIVRRFSRAGMYQELAAALNLPA